MFSHLIEIHHLFIKYCHLGNIVAGMTDGRIYSLSMPVIIDMINRLPILLAPKNLTDSCTRDIVGIEI